MALREVEESFHFFLQNGLANSTKRCYESGQRRYFTFCDKVNFSPLPASENSIALFISYLGSEKVSYKTIKSYLAAVRHLHISFGLSFIGLSPRTHLLIRGIKRTQSDAAVRPRLPITPSVLRNIKTSLAGKPLDYDNWLYWAAMCLAFFGFLCCGEFTVPEGQECDASVHLMVNDIAMDPGLYPAGISVHIKASKTDPFRQGVTLYLGRTGVDLCPVAAMVDFLSVRGSSPGPLFQFKDGSALHRQQLVRTVRSTLAGQGFDVSQYCGHSFRIGAATTAAQNGIEDCVIKTLGQWESTAYQLYVHTPRATLAFYTSKLTK